MKTVREIKKEINKHFIHGGPSEFDQRLNDLNRMLIEAFARERGKAWLGKINRYKADRGKPYLVKYEGQQVYNFAYTFIVPCCDEELISLIKGRRSPTGAPVRTHNWFWTSWAGLRSLEAS